MKSLVVKGPGVHVDEALAHDHDGGLADVGKDPFAAQLFGDGARRARSCEEIGDDGAFVRGSLDDALKQGLGFLGVVVER